MPEDSAATAAVFALNAADVLIVAAGVAALLVVGFIAGRREADTRDFFLGGRRIPAWAVCLSFIATEVSAATIVTVPAAAYGGNWNYLQMFIGSAVARIAIAFLFIPAFYRFDCTTIYEFLRDRFGPGTQYTASIFFFMTRLLASGVRLGVAALGTATIIGWGPSTTGNYAGVVVAIIVFTLVAIAFIAFGGIKAVVWTNVLQAIVFVAGGAATLIFLYHRIDGGFDAILAAAGPAKREVIRTYGGFADPWFLPAAALSGLLVNLTAFGTDQDFMQRLLTIETRRASQRSLMGTIVIGLPVVILFLSIGTLLYVFHQQQPGAVKPMPGRTDDVLPLFVATVMPHALRGFLLLTILMASIDSPLGSLAASFVTDLYRPLIRRTASERHYLWVSRLSVAAFGVLLACVAFFMSHLERLLDVAFQVFCVTGGSLLGVFLLGLLTRSRGDFGNVVGMVAAVLVTGGLLFAGKYQFALPFVGVPTLGWTWLIAVGTGVTLVVAFVLNLTLPARLDRFQRSP